MLTQKGNFLRGKVEEWAALNAQLLDTGQLLS